MYVKCPTCGDMVWLQPWEHCRCNHVVISEQPGGRCVCSGGEDTVDLYQFQKTSSEPVPWKEIPASRVKKKPWWYPRKSDMIPVALFLLALFSVLYARIGVIGNTP